MNGKAILNRTVTLAVAGITATMMAAHASAAGPMPGKTRLQVQAELAQWARHPLASDGYRFIGGEGGYVYEAPSAGPQAGPGSAMGAGVTREQVRQAYEQSRRNPMTADGYRHIGGEVGSAYVGPPAESTALGSGTGVGMRGKSRAQVRQELIEFERDPASVDIRSLYTGG